MKNIDYSILNSIDNMEVINVIRSALKRIDERLVCHGERVAYIVHEMMAFQKVDNIDEKHLFLLSVFHDIGAYKTEEISRMLDFETTDVHNHAIYGYLFLYNLSPLKKYADAILHHHTSHEKLKKTNCQHKEYAELIFLADRIDVLTQTSEGPIDYTILREMAPYTFNPEYVELFLKANKERKIIEKLSNNEYIETIEKIITNIEFDHDEVTQYLKMLVYSIDFRSEYTVTHTINTTSISVTLARMLGYVGEDLSDIYYGALLHDIGKITIPLEILESPDRLSPNETTIMRTHVIESDNIISRIIDEKIRNIATRHHEKLNGNGYPSQLNAENLTGPERIVAVADILSALCGVRSYKDSFSKEKTLQIIESMMERGDLCPKVCQCVLANYDEIMKTSKSDSQYILDIYLKISKDYEYYKEALKYKI